MSAAVIKAFFQLVYGCSPFHFTGFRTIRDVNNGVEKEDFCFERAIMCSPDVTRHT